MEAGHQVSVAGIVCYTVQSTTSTARDAQAAEQSAWLGEQAPRACSSGVASQMQRWEAGGCCLAARLDGDASVPEQARGSRTAASAHTAVERLGEVQLAGAPVVSSALLASAAGRGLH